MRTVKLVFVCTLLLLVSAVQASGIDFLESKSWKEILAKAKKERKLIFLDAYAVWCGPCKYMQREVFSDGSVGEFYNTNFINVKIDMEKGEGVDLSEELGVASYPTLFFINGEGEVVHKKIGAVEVEEFLELGAQALDPARQFYTVKKKAVAGSLEPAPFHQWIHAAEAIEDPDLKEIIGSYLAAARYPLLEKEMLAIMLDHGSLNEEQLRFLATNKEKGMLHSGKSKEAYEAALLKRVAGWAIEESFKEGDLDFTVYRQKVQAFFPASAAIETQKMKIKYYHYKEEYDTCLTLLAESITSPAFRLKAGDLSTLIVNYIKEISDQNRVEEFLFKVNAYQLSPADRALAYHKDLALVALYMAKEDRPQMERYGRKILADPNAPDAVKISVNKVLDN